MSSFDPDDPDHPLLRLRITHITSTMSTPLPTLARYYVPSSFATAIPSGALPQSMPVLRIFGTTPGLQKICANIHLCYPYFFVPFPMDSSDPLRPERVVKLCQRFAVSLNHAICLAMRQNPTGQSSTSKYGGGTDPRHLHVVSVMLVKGVPFYGYHIGYSYFLKVSLVNPSRMFVALEQLRKPVVLGREWQPHEAHLNHVLQFMCDFDLYGCGWLDIGGGTFREPLPDGDPYDDPPDPRIPPEIFNSLTTPSSMLYPDSLSPPKDTYTPLEIDVLPHHILNRRRLKPRKLHHDFIELLHSPLDPDEKLVPAVAELWEDERRRRLAKGLSLSEAAMMPGSGGMGGRSKEELGYLLAGGERKQNRGGDWKISDELWAMIEDRMSDESRRKGQLSFERFSADVSAGKNGEKRKYEKWVMTTFEAVSAHWPKQPKSHTSTQRSRRFQRHQKGESSAMATPLHSINLPTSPANGEVKTSSGSSSSLEEHKPQHENLDHEKEEHESTYSSDEEQNPFNAFAMSQLSQGQSVDIPIDVNSRMVQRDVIDEDDEDVEEAERQRHEQDARQHADEGVRFRATQAPVKRSNEEDEVEGDEFDDLDEGELDELFRRTVANGLGSAQSTPQRRGPGGSVTPTTVSSVSGGVESRRVRRTQRLREQAGLGDLSTIIDRSSISISPGSNPFDARLRTPTKIKSPLSDKATPTSLVRNLFVRNRQPSISPHSNVKRAILPPLDKVVLTPARRSLGRLTVSPEADERESTPTPSMPPKNGIGRDLEAELDDIKPKLEEIDVRGPTGDLSDPAMPPARQVKIQMPSKSTSSTNGTRRTTLSTDFGPLSPTIGSGKRRAPSPTFQNDPQPLSAESASDPDASAGRNRKRVRLASPVDSTPTPPQDEVTSQTFLPTSGDTHNSKDSEPTDGSGSTVLNLSKTSWQPRDAPPLARDLSELETIGLPSVIYQEPHYSSPLDVPSRAKMFAGRMFSLKGKAVSDLPDFEFSTTGNQRWLKSKKFGVERARYGWEYALSPPPRAQVAQWCQRVDDDARARASQRARLTSQLEAPTQKNKYGFKYSQRKKTEASKRESQSMSVLALEVFAKSRHQLLPDPEKDEVTAVFFCYQNEDESLPDTTVHPGYYAGYVVVESAQSRRERVQLEGVPCTFVNTELDLLNWVIDLVKGWDPDVLAGWELHNGSWGYLASRAEQAFSVDLMEQLSRVVSGHSGPKKDFYSATHTSTFKVSGRHILNIWRICKSEVNLTQYTFENVAFHLLHQRIPHYSSANLTALWKSKIPSHTHRVLKYLFQRVVVYMEIVDKAEIITKNAEFARVFGVDFASVMFRGSQFKVESFMFRIAKPESFVLVSPSKQQVGLQNAPFAVPLIAEPESKYYNHPILVLDFQSLYPSVMIAYNICFSTCLGRVEKFKGTDKFGFTELKVADGLLELLKDYLTVTPNGMIFVKPAVRKSLLAKMLGEILDTRVMVKHAMKGARADKSLLQLLNARQLGLKLMANVTYGYTSATYSGRMPCIEVADSIVQTGRETLEKAQELIHSRTDWGAQVVYGDTDSLFVALPGRSREQAFKIGNDIADTVTAMNPKPVKLKFEKVYMGSVLMAKKRYVGFKYEHPDDTEPVFDAKGIETIRRDGFPAQQKIEEVCLKLLFRTQDLSQIKEFCRQEWTKILQGRVSMQDFIVAKEVRLGSYSDKGVPPPGAAVAYRRILKDPRDEPQYAERVPYIVSNAEGRRLIDRARTPEEMLANRSLGIDAEYYIRNLLIPPLSRIFNLVGADVENWYDSMPRTKRAGRYDRNLAGGMRIDSHFRSSHCVVCGVESSDTVCSECMSDPSTTAHSLLSREHLAEEKLASFHKICASCSATPVSDRILCDSIDCPVLYGRVQAQRDVDDLVDVRTVLEKLNVQDNDEVVDTDKNDFGFAQDW